MVWAALGFFGSITSAINYAWQRPAIRLLEAQAGVVPDARRGGPPDAGRVGAVVGAHGGQDALVRQRAGALSGTAPFESFLVEWASSLIFVVVVGLLFYFVPNARVRFRDVWPGAIVTGALWRLALKGFGWYVRDLSRFSVHGSLAAVVVFLMWVYLSAVILIYGVEFTVAYARLRRGLPDESQPVDSIEPPQPDVAPVEAMPAGTSTAG